MAVGPRHTSSSIFWICFNIFLVIFLTSFFTGIFVLLRKKWAWIISVMILFIILIILLANLVDEFGDLVWLFKYRGYSAFYLTKFIIILIATIFFLIPFFLLLLDRKNFWKVAS